MWQQLTLTNLSLEKWRNKSYLYSLFSGSLNAWRRSSWILQWGETLGLILLALLFSLAPFVSNALIGVLLIACAIFWVLLTVSDEEIGNFTPIHLVILLYWGICIVATALSPVKIAAFSGLAKLTLYLTLFALMARILRSNRMRSWLIGIYLHISLIVSVYGIRQWIEQVPPLATWNDPNSTQANVTRVYSYLGNPNLLGSYLLPAIALSLAALLGWRGWGRKALALTMLIVNCACLQYTGSRGAMIGLVALIIVFLVLLWHWWSVYLPTFWRKWSLPIILGIPLGLLLFGLLFIESLRDRVSSIFAGRKDSSNNFRINVWQAVLKMIQDRPIIGIGPGNTAFNKVYPLYMKSRFTALSAYSVLLEIMVETGIIGLTCFIWLLIVTMSQGWQQIQNLREINTPELPDIEQDKIQLSSTIPAIWQNIINPRSPDGYWLMAAMATITGMMAHGFFDTVWYRPEINMLWWLMVALIASYYRPWRSI